MAKKNEQSNLTIIDARSPVCISRCTKCGLEHMGFAPHDGACPRCGRLTHADNWISHPTPEMIDQAHRESR